LLIFINNLNVNNVNNIINIMLTKAIIGFLNLKNIVVHDKFNTNCIKKKVNALQYGKHFLSFHTKKNDINNKM